MMDPKKLQQQVQKMAASRTIMSQIVDHTTTMMSNVLIEMLGNESMGYKEFIDEAVPSGKTDEFFARALGRLSSMPEVMAEKLENPDFKFTEEGVIELVKELSMTHWIVTQYTLRALGRIQDRREHYEKGTLKYPAKKEDHE